MMNHDQQQPHSCNQPECTRCRSLFDEMLILKAQLVDAKNRLQQTSPRRTNNANNTTSNISPIRSRDRRSSSVDQPTNVKVNNNNNNNNPTPPIMTEREERTETRLNLLNSNPSTFPYRYVPPADFLPAPFVEAHIDWLMILDRFAQLFHANHVAQPMVTLDDPQVLKSTITLLQLKVRQQERELDHMKARLDVAEHEKINLMRSSGFAQQQQQQQHHQSMSRNRSNNISGIVGPAPSIARHQQPSHNNNNNVIDPNNLNPDFMQRTEGSTQPTRHTIDVSGAGLMQMFNGGENNNNNNTKKKSGNKNSRGGGYDNDNDGDTSSLDGEGPSNENNNNNNEGDSYAAHRMARNDKIERYRQMKRASTPVAGTKQVQQPTNSKPSTPKQNALVVAPPNMGSKQGSQTDLTSVAAAAAANNTNNQPVASRSSSTTPKPTMAWNNIMAADEAKRNSSPSPAATNPVNHNNSNKTPPNTVNNKSDVAAKNNNNIAVTSSPAGVEGSPLPDGWAERKDPVSGKTYYFNKKTRETSWKRPTAA